jgi:hypothetical protein
MAISDLLKQWSSYGHEYVPYLEQMLATVPNAEALLGDMIARNTSMQDSGAFEGGWNPTPQYISNGWFANNVSPYASNSQEDLRNRAMSAATPVGIAYDFLKEQGIDPAQYGLRPEMAWELGRANELTYTAAQDHSNWFQTMAGPIGIVAAPFAGTIAAGMGAAGGGAAAAMGAATFGAPAEAKFLAGLYGLGGALGSALAPTVAAPVGENPLLAKVMYGNNPLVTGNPVSGAATMADFSQGTLGSVSQSSVPGLNPGGYLTGGFSTAPQIASNALTMGGYADMASVLGGTLGFTPGMGVGEWNSSLGWSDLLKAGDLVQQGLSIFGGDNSAPNGSMGAGAENPDLLTDLSNATFNVRNKNAGGAYGGLNTFAVGDAGLFVPR